MNVFLAVPSREPIGERLGAFGRIVPLLLGVAMMAAAALAIRSSLGRMMTLDELYTVTLIDTPSLGHMVDGAVRGVDGNPPLHLSLAWVLVHALPLAPDLLLRSLNLVLLAITAVLLARILRPVADALTVAVALTLLCAVDGAVVYSLLEARTYALYLCLVTATLWATLAVVDRPFPGRSAGLALVGALATLSHSFAGFYVVATIGSCAFVCWTNQDRRRMLALALGGLPALAAMLGWILISFPRQTAVATPYGWIPRPDFATLIATLTGSPALTVLGLLGLAWLAARGELAPRLVAWRRTTVAPHRAILVAVPIAYATLTCAAWVGSQLITPFFLGRYFIPDVVIGAWVLIGALAALRRVASPPLFAAAAALCILSGLATVATGSGPIANVIPCLRDDGQLLEQGVRDDLPVVAESPLAWLPRSRYAPGRTSLYPLDWDTVLNHPYRAHNNAMDFHIMEILKSWAPPGSVLPADVLSTDALLSRHPRFLLLDEANRGWWRDLRAARPANATLLRQSPGCRLWQVDVPSSE